MIRSPRRIRVVRYLPILAILLMLTIPSVASAATSFFEPDVYSAGYTRDLGVADFDDDGHQDIVTASHSGNLSLRFGDGNGEFELVDYPISATAPGALEVKDINGDGALDVLLVDGMTYHALLFPGDGDGGLEAPLTVSSNADRVFAVGDFGGSAALDVAMSLSLGQIALLIQQPNGSFVQESQLSLLTTPSDLLASDLDDDGDDDLVAISDGQVFTILRGDDGEFDPYVAHPVGGASDVEVADMNSDGDLDIATVRYASNGGELGGVLSVLLATSPGIWAPAVEHDTGVFPAGLAVRDLDGDADMDVLITPASSERFRVMIQGGDGSFESVVAGTFYVSGIAGDTTIADFDEDGEGDIAMAEWGSGLKVAFGDALDVTPFEIDFGWLAAGEAASRSITVRNTGSAPFTTAGIGIAGDAAPFSIVADGCRGRTLARRETCEMGVRFAAPAVSDGFFAELLIHGSGSSETRAVFLSAASYMPVFLYASPGTVDFGFTRAGVTSAPRVVQIVNGGGQAVAVEAATTTAGFTVRSDGCSGKTLLPDARCDVGVSFRPTAISPLEGTLSVTFYGGTAPASAALRGSRTPAQRQFRTAPQRQQRPPAVDYGPVERDLARLVDAVPKLLRGGPVRSLKLPSFTTLAPGMLRMRLYVIKRGKQRVPLASASTRITDAQPHRLSFRLAKAKRKLLRGRKATRVKAVFSFQPKGTSIVFKQAPEVVVRPPVKRRGS